MRIAILVNTLQAADGGETTYRLATAGVSRGHEVWIFSPGSFAYDPDERIRADARSVPAGNYRSAKQFVKTLGSKDAIREWIVVDELDVLLLRSNPSVQKGWAQSAPIHFGRIAARRGVLVLNDPGGLAKGMNKLYLQSFPQVVRPRTLITRDRERIEAFAREEGTIIIKPLHGSGGRGVFILRPGDLPNLAQMIRSISRDGYVIAQEYLPAAEEGDTRLFLMNGRPLVGAGSYAAFRRIRHGEDIRSNIHAGGRLRRATVDETMLRVAEVVRPRLVADGMFLVGLDIVGTKLLEINVFTPGGLGSAQKLAKVDFTQEVLAALERKVEYARDYRRVLSNTQLATL